MVCLFLSSSPTHPLTFPLVSLYSSGLRPANILLLARLAYPQPGAEPAGRRRHPPAEQPALRHRVAATPAADAPAAPTTTTAAAAHAAAAHADGLPAEPAPDAAQGAHRAGLLLAAERAREPRAGRAGGAAPPRGQRRYCCWLEREPRGGVVGRWSPTFVVLPACLLAGSYLHTYLSRYLFAHTHPPFFEIHPLPPANTPTHQHTMHLFPTHHSYSASHGQLIPPRNPRTTLCTARLYFLFFAHKRRPFLPSLPPSRRAVRSLSLSFLACSNCSCSICSLLLFFSLSASMMLSTRPTPCSSMPRARKGVFISIGPTQPTPYTCCTVA